MKRHGASSGTKRYHLKRRGLINSHCSRKGLARTCRLNSGAHFGGGGEGVVLDPCLGIGVPPRV